jgi:Cdc6-like AAA superfamily ATPase
MELTAESLLETATFVYGPIGSGKTLTVREVVDDFHRLASQH